MQDEKILALIQIHLQRYPELDIMDVYKLLHQGVFGPGHAITNVKVAREWLDRESEILRPNAAELLVENIHPEAKIVRVHMRPFLALGGDLKRLLDAFVQSSRMVEGNSAELADWWSVFSREAVNTFGNRFDYRKIELFGRTRASEHWPASHHSPIYDRVYKPAYRVLTRSVAETLLAQQGIQFQ